MTICYPMDCTMPGFPVRQQLVELAQSQVHRVSDAIKPSHPLSSPSPLPSVLPSIGVFPNESLLPIRWPKYWSFSFNISPSSEYSGLISGLTGWIFFKSKGLSKSSPPSQFKSLKSSVLRFLYSPTLTSIFHYWKNNSFD